jgi:hypothetical protein
VIDRRIMRRWADATRHQRWDEANQLWAQLMADWPKQPPLNQRYWNQLLDRRMASLERKEQRVAIDDAEWDIRREDITR